MILSFYGPRDREGLHYLRRARSIHPSAKRVVVVEWGNFESRGPVFRAIAEGHLENLLIRPERPRDEEFHGGVSDLLQDWHWAQGTSGFEAVRIFGHSTSAPTCCVTRSPATTSPSGFYEADTGEQPAHPAGLGLEDPEFPVLDLRFTSPPGPLANPSDTDLVEAFGLTTQLDPRHRLGHRDHRRRARWSRRGRVRRLGGAVDPRHRARGHRGPGGHELADPQLPGVRAGHQRQPPGLPVLPAGLDVRRRLPLLPLGHRARGPTATSSACSSPTERSARTRTTIVATGVDYRRLGIPEIEELTGRGVFYGAAVTEARAMTGQPVHVVGGGNSAGQAALHLAKYARHVTLLVRGARRRGQHVGVPHRADAGDEERRHRPQRDGHRLARAVDARLTEIEITDGSAGASSGARATACSSSSAPHRTPSGSRASSRATRRGSSRSAQTPSATPTTGTTVRHPLETSRIGVFAIGDTRRGSIKRVATAVGDGAAVVAAVHQHLAERIRWPMTPRPTREYGDPVVPAMRWLLGLAAVLVFLAGVQLFLFPLDTDTRFAWTIGSPMTAVFLGASYWSAMGLELSGAVVPSAGPSPASPFLRCSSSPPSRFVVTIVHLDLFHLAPELPVATRAVTWGWIAVYAVVPVLMALAWWLQSRAGTAVPAPRGLPTCVRATLAVLAVGLVTLGMALLVAPQWADAAWPWPLTPLTARAVGAWNVGLGVAAGHAWLVDDARSLRPIGVTGVLFGVLQTVALVRYGDELDWSSVPGVGYVVGLAAITAVVAALLLGLRRAPWAATPGSPSAVGRAARASPGPSTGVRHGEERPPNWVPTAQGHAPDRRGDAGGPGSAMSAAPTRGGASPAYASSSVASGLSMGKDVGRGRRCLDRAVERRLTGVVELSVVR